MPPTGRTRGARSGAAGGPATAVRGCRRPLPGCRPTGVRPHTGWSRTTCTASPSRSRGRPAGVPLSSAAGPATSARSPCRQRSGSPSSATHTTSAASRSGTGGRRRSGRSAAASRRGSRTPCVPPSSPRQPGPERVRPERRRPRRCTDRRWWCRHRTRPRPGRSGPGHRPPRHRRRNHPGRPVALQRRAGRGTGIAAPVDGGHAARHLPSGSRIQSASARASTSSMPLGRPARVQRM